MSWDSRFIVRLYDPYSGRLGQSAYLAYEPAWDALIGHARRYFAHGPRWSVSYQPLMTRHGGTGLEGFKVELHLQDGSNFDGKGILALLGVIEAARPA